MRIYFSNQGRLSTFTRFVEATDLSEPSELNIAVHPKWTSVHPAHLVFATALALKVGKKHARIEGTPPESARYLDRMGLYDFTSTESPFKNYTQKEPAGRFVPISVIKTEAEQTRFMSEMVPLLHLGEKDARIIKYVMGELIRNVLEHSLAKDGAIVAAQYYKNNNQISLAICDTGIGLWKSLQVWHPRTDAEAIRLALMPGVSGTTRQEGGTAENAGAGLFFSKSIARTTRSFFSVYSGKAAYTMLKPRSDVKKLKLIADPFEDRHALTEEAPDFQGTLVALDIALDKTEEFQELLSKIGEVYDVSIQERKRQAFRKPNFI